MTTVPMPDADGLLQIRKAVRAELGIPLYADGSGIDSATFLAIAKGIRKIPEIAAFVRREIKPVSGADFVLQGRMK